ncbi:BEL1-like homeodomain protein 1 [Typha latifolia]|uniref:BEL1-like homeodomain protein 1 n=1 Tax=Typha latifolia TaxID=4733 RepID=UPI003C2C8A34
MATYFHGGSEIQTDGLQTLYLMNPSYVGYPDAGTAAHANMVLLNSTMNSLNPISFAQAAGAGQSNQQHFVGIPLQPTLLQSQESNNPWMPAAPVNDSVDMASQLGIRRPTMQRGLSLSLSSDEMVNAVVGVSPMSGEEVRVVGPSSAAASGVSNGVHSFLTGSKYLKAAQQLLDEVVSVGKGSELAKGSNSRNNGDSEGVGNGKSHEEVGIKQGSDLTTAEKQELQMKKAKLVNMLDEVEQRYRQYHHQMQIVVSTFEAVAGPKSARTYTDLALQTISKQFRCLRDAIAGQIRATSRSLGEEEAKSVGSRLRLVDHHLRQQRALQQLGMMQHNAWRPQRGLPERSVSILRAWLFEHFLHPYPKDSDKVMLAKQTGLTRSQVSNWFINARVRLWKPMVEEMYLEETKDQEQNNSDENSTKNEKNKDHQDSSSTKTGQGEKLKAKQDSPSSKKISSISMPRFGDEAMIQQKLKKARSEEQQYANNMFDSGPASNRELLMKFMEGRGGVGEQGYYGGYPIGEIGRFGSEQFTPAFSGNGVSLTLGLQHCENLSLSAAQPSYLSNETMGMGRRLEMSTEANDYCSLNNNNNNHNNNNNNNNSTVAHPSNAYDINMETRKRFAAQLLPDFVA